MKKRSGRDDVAARVLRANGNPEELDRILQDECRRRASRKLAATLLCAPAFRFPTALSVEQCTADNVADFHASLVAAGTRVVDLTCGLGIDAFHIARKAREVVCIDVDPNVASAISHNAEALGLTNVAAVCEDCRTWLDRYDGERFDVAFIDPARRADDGSRLYSMAQCNPDVVELLPKIRRVAERLIIKASPMLDIAGALSELDCVERVYAVGTKTECKELLFDICFDKGGIATEIAAVIIGYGTVVSHSTGPTTYASSLAVGDLLGEPWPAVMKMRPQGLPGEQLHPSTFLFRNPDCGFPGNIYRVARVEAFSSSNLRRLAKEKIEASVATRNFPLTAEALRLRLKARESSTMRLMATTLAPDVQILVFLTPFVVENS